MKHQAVILIMIDGLGIGENSRANPLTAFSPRVLLFTRKQLGPLPGRGKILQTRVDGGVRGRPQSATNHTTLFTGTNAPAFLGYHLSGFPNARLRRQLARHSLFRQILDLGLWPTFANCFTPAFFLNRPRWVSASTVMSEAAGLRLRSLADLEEGRGLYMDITHHVLAAREPGIRPRTPARAAEILLELAGRHHLVFFEYFLTDKAGHRGDLQQALKVLRILDEFLFHLVDSRGDEISVIVTSDHGNLENIDLRQHTSNPVATLIWGRLGEVFPPGALELAQITPRIVRFLGAS